MKYPWVLLFLLFVSCRHRPGAPTTAAQPVVQRPQKTTDTITAESQLVRFDRAKHTHFLGSAVSGAVAYSFLDVHDYEDDSMTKGQLLRIMPNDDQYLWKYDPRPKVRLDKAQAHQLLAIINDPRNYSLGAAFCDFPRNCFCFYDSQNRMIGFYELCFECARVQSIPEFTISRKGGLSDRGVAAFRKFCLAAGITMIKK